MELLPFVDILKVFNNPISEEQAWAVCYQCAHFLYRNPTQEFYQDVTDSGINSIWISRHGDVLLRKGLQEPNGSGKGPPPSPHKSQSLERRLSSGSIVPCRSQTGVIATEIDAVQSLGMAIFEALDYGIEATEERQLSAGLESAIASMTQTDACLLEEEYDAASQNADDEGIEKDADVELEHRCTVEDVLKLCRQHLSSKQDPQHHFKAVCRALATEAGELFTFLDKISSGREKLTETADEDAKRLEELQRADWACLWVQVMRSLRQGVLLKRIEHVTQPPLDYELTPFEMILEDIRSRRYTLHKIMVNGEIPHKVKNDAHEVILNFIRSRPPLKRVDDRKLKPKLPSPPDPHELLLQDIRAKPKLRPVREGKLLVETSRTRLNEEDELEALVPVKRVIKPDLNLILNNSFDESSDEDETLAMSTPSFSSSSASSTPSPQKSSLGSSDSTSGSIQWRRAVMKDSLTQDLGSHRPSKLQRRHTIMVCESPIDGKVAPELPTLAEEEDEPSPVKESHSLASLHSGLRPNPSHIHPSFPKTSFSDHDIQNQVSLRHPQGIKRRSSMEHRRSLTSLPTGLCAIPEMEDSGGSGADNSPGSQRPSPLVRRSWSSEQAPPPNPSPPIKARVRAGASMSMSGTRSRPALSSTTPSQGRQSMSAEAGLPVQKSSNVTQSVGSSNKNEAPATASSTCFSYSTISQSLSCMPRSDEKNINLHAVSDNPPSSSAPVPTPRSSVSSPTKAKHVSVASIFLTSPKTSSPSDSPSPHRTSPSSPSSPPPISAQRVRGSTDISLDTSTSSQSPFYRKHMPRNLQQSHVVIEPTPQRQSRWRNNLNAQEERKARRQGVAEQTPPSSQSQSSGCDTNSQMDPTSSEPVPSRRLSLDGGVNKYSGNTRYLRGDDQREEEECGSTKPTVAPIPSRRLSLETNSRTATGKVRSPEEEERITRWRTLQSDDLENRKKVERSTAVIRSPSSGSLVKKSEDGGSSFSTRYQQLKQQYQSEQQKHVIDSQTTPSTNPPQQQQQQPQQSQQHQNHHTHHKSRISTSGRRLLYESPDALQHHQVTEEARLSRWRQLEEGGESSNCNDEDSFDQFQDLSESDLEYVSDGHAEFNPKLSNQPVDVDPNPSDDSESMDAIPGTSASFQTKQPSGSHSLPKRWENPVECLSLTLEEVTHIRSVLTKAELESLISHPDLYQMVSKSKLCFTCKTTRFSLFGEWGSKCKFCKRTVCSKCLRKMNVPSDHFRNIPVYSLSPTPFSQEVQEFIQNFVKKVPNSTTLSPRDQSPSRHHHRSASPQPPPPSSSSTDSNQQQKTPPQVSTANAHLPSTSNNNNFDQDNIDSTNANNQTFNKSIKPLQRSQSVLVSGQKSQPSLSSSVTAKAAVKGPLMAICCDCKGMITEIIRASKTSLALITASGGPVPKSSGVINPPKPKQLARIAEVSNTSKLSSHSFRY